MVYYTIIEEYKFTRQQVIDAFECSKAFESIMSDNPQYYVTSENGYIYLSVEDDYYDVNDPEAHRTFVAHIGDAGRQGYNPLLEFEE